MNSLATGEKRNGPYASVFFLPVSDCFVVREQPILCRPKRRKTEQVGRGQLRRWLKYPSCQYLGRYLKNIHFGTKNSGNGTFMWVFLVVLRFVLCDNFDIGQMVNAFRTFFRMFYFYIY